MTHLWLPKISDIFYAPLETFADKLLNKTKKFNIETFQQQTKQKFTITIIIKGYF